MRKIILAIILIVFSFSLNLYSQTALWAEKISGDDSDNASGVTVDFNGDIYVIGQSNSAILNFNNDKTIVKRYQTLNSEGYIAKYNSSGMCQWVERLSCIGIVNINNIVLDNEGNIFVAGTFSQDTIHFNNNKFLVNTNWDDIFVAKYSTHGICQWAEKVAGDGLDMVEKIVLDNNNIYIVGTFQSSVLNFNNGKTLSNSEKFHDDFSRVDGFLAKYDKEGLCQWVEKITGDDIEHIKDISLAKDGNIYLIGHYKSDIVNFNNNITLINNQKIKRISKGFVAKYDKEGLCQWAEQISSDGWHNITTNLVTDSQDNIYITGECTGPKLEFNNDISIDEKQSYYGQSFLVKYDKDGLCQWAESILSNSNSIHSIHSLIVDNNDDIYFAGVFSTDIIYFNNSTFLKNSGEGTDSFFAKYNEEGLCQWATGVSGNNSENVSNIGIDNYGYIYAVGSFKSDIVYFNNEKELSNSNAFPNAFLVKYTTILNLPKVETNYIDKVTKNSAVIGCTLIEKGNEEIIVSGVCWSREQRPTIADNTSNDGSTELGKYISWMFDLEPNTRYYIRAYATNDIGTSYGNQMSFQTYISEPTITTNELSLLTNTSVMCGGDVIKDGGANIVARGVCWSVNQNPTTKDGKMEEKVTGIGSFDSFITDLTPNTTYYIRAYATNASGTAYGDEKSFTTLKEPLLPIVKEIKIKMVRSMSAFTKSYIKNDGGDKQVLRGVCWSRNPEPTINDDKTEDGIGAGYFESMLSGLIHNTIYYVRTYATNSSGTTYSVSAKIRTTGPTSIIDFDLEKLSLNIYPNPTSDNIEISLTNSDCTNTTLKLYDMTGRLAMDLSQELTNSNSQSLSVNLSTLTSGEYTIILTCGNEKVSKSVVVVR